MSQPIYKVYYVKFNELWSQLPKPEQDSLLQKVAATLDQVGGKSHVVCDCHWSSENWNAFGLEEYPNIEAVQEHDRLLQALNWFRYQDSMTTLGTAFTGM